MCHSPSLSTEPGLPSYSWLYFLVTTSAANNDVHANGKTKLIMTLNHKAPSGYTFCTTFRIGVLMKFNEVQGN